ncbi:hypothetical protein GN958_ATG19798 [Phytophthora infestans]|uniref:Uncharacterized protein n=1 Tax=Phytophthora infestans TaxID=4787 RepID=A0A8S9TWP4_PHYIN|nr:hypothetical protein GN958_ATG19798 [Phytophthora infestans]
MFPDRNSALDGAAGCQLWADAESTCFSSMRGRQERQGGAIPFSNLGDGSRDGGGAEQEGERLLLSR